MYHIRFHDASKGLFNFSIVAAARCSGSYCGILARSKQFHPDSIDPARRTRLLCERTRPKGLTGGIRLTLIGWS